MPTVFNRRTLFIKFGMLDVLKAFWFSKSSGKLFFASLDG